MPETHKRLCPGCNKERWVSFFKGKKCGRCVKNASHANTLKKYGLTVGQYEEMRKVQGNACAICGVSAEGKRNMAADHDHHTGAVRGLLCFMCNYVLGQWRDNPARFIAAGKYLSQHQGVHFVPDLDKANGRKPTKAGRQYIKDMT